MTVDDKHDLSYDREISEQEHSQLQDDFRFLRDLAQQRGFVRLLAAAQAWRELLSEGVEEGAEDGRVSASTQHKARRGLIAFAGLSEEFLDGAERLLDEAGPSGAKHRRSIEQFRGTESYRELQDLRMRAARGEDLVRVGADGSLELVGDVSCKAEDHPVAVAGYAGVVVPNVLIACEERFRQTERKVRALAQEVGEGTPRLLVVQSKDGSGEPAKVTLQQLPLLDMAMLEEAYRQADAQDAVGVLLRNRERSAVSFNGESAEMAVRGVRSNDGIDAVPEANFDLELELIGPEPIDYWAPVVFSAEEGGREEEMFAGVVQTAEVDRQTARLRCEGGAMVVDHTRGGLLFDKIKPADLIRSMIAQSGWTGSLNLSEEPAEDVEEEFEVVVPVKALRVPGQQKLGSIELLRLHASKEALERLQGLGDSTRHRALADGHLDADSYAKAIVTSRTPHEAEDEGIARIETAIAWLIARNRYGTALLPNDSGVAFDRESALSHPEPGPTVLVKGLSTGRQWLRWWQEPEAVGRERPDEPPDPGSPSLPTSVPIAVRQGLLGLQAAASQRDPYAQAISIWQAIESFAAKTKCRRIFSDEELEELRSSMPSGLNVAQRDALEGAIGRLNDPPVRERMLQRLKRDGIPISSKEVSTLDRLRRARNDAVHGRERNNPPNREEINYGIGLLARMLVFRVAQLEEA